MAEHSPPALLPQQAFEQIMSNLESQRDKYAIQMVCRAWRQMGLECSAAHASVLAGRLKRDEIIDSLGLWLRPRAHMVQHLQYEHLDCANFNSIAAEALEPLTGSLRSLDLIISKYTKNRRGLPGPATLNWLPVFPHLTSLSLRVAWRTIENLELTRWAPNLVEFTLSGTLNPQDTAVDVTSEEHWTGSNSMPKSLKKLTLLDMNQELDGYLSPKWLTSLHSLSFLYPTGGQWPMVCPILHPPPVLSGGVAVPFMKKMKHLEELAINIDIFDVAKPSFALYRGLSSLSNLKVLKLYSLAVHNPSFAAVSRIRFDQLKKLETVHFLGPIDSCFVSNIVKSCPTITELWHLARPSFGISQEELAHEVYSSNIETLVVNYTILKQSSEHDEEYGWWEDENAFYNASMLPKLKQLTIVAMDGYYPSHHYMHQQRETYLLLWFSRLLQHRNATNSPQVKIQLCVDENDDLVAKLKEWLDMTGNAKHFEFAAIDDSQLKEIQMWDSWERSDPVEAEF